VREEFRGKGIGKILMAECAAIALREGFWAMRWEVLEWNQPAIDFYKKLGAKFLHDWMEVRLEGEGLRQLAESAAK
jgi:GNAT superfamily N-acetyltransferase